MSHVVTFQPKLKYVEKVSVKSINIRVHPTVNRHIYSKAFAHVFMQEIPREIWHTSEESSLTLIYVDVTKQTSIQN